MPMRRDDMIEALMTRGGISQADAERVLSLYMSRKIRAVRHSPHDGYVIRDGIFLDRDVIRRALQSIRTKKNPTVTIMRNPAARVLTDRVISIRYIHNADKNPYEHVFKRGVRVEFLPDGSARLYRPDGRPIWEDV